MRRLIRLATYLYPASWRARYAREFEALLEDVSPRGTDVLDVLGGAVKMQLTQASFWKFAAGFALAGVLVASAVGWFAMPDRFRATGVFAAPTAATPVESNVRVQELMQTTLSRTSLAEIIMRENLYPRERYREPLEDVIATMRVQDLRVHPSSSGAFSLDFVYPDRSQAERTVRDLTARMQSGGGVKVLEVSGAQVTPNRFRIACMGLGIGLLTGAVIAVAMRMSRRTVAISSACAVVGFLLAGALSFMIPNTYESNAVLLLPDAPSFAREALSRAALAAIIDKHRLYGDQWEKKSKDQLIDAMRAKDLRVETVHLRGSSAALHISFAYPDQFAAQSVLLDLLQQNRQALHIEVLDAPSLPQSPTKPNRYVIAMLGLSFGLLSGAAFVRVRRPAMA